MTNNLALKATRGMLWSTAENLSLQLIQFLISIVLARLLLPEQFGLIGMLSLFMALAQSLLDSGFGSALVQKQNANQVDACSIFYFNLGIGLALTLVLWIAAPLIADFFQQPALTELTKFLSLSLIVNAFGLIPLTILTKRLAFRALLNVNLLAVVISGTIGVAGALAGLGVWSLAIQGVLAAFIRTALAWRASRWRPEWIFSLASLQSMFTYGSRLLLSGLLETFFLYIYMPLIGKLYTAANLGYYVRAQSMQTMAAQTTGTALARVMFPAMAPIQDDRIRLKQVFRKSVVISVFFHFPLTIGLIAVASPLIQLLMTDRWAPSVPYFQLMCLVGLLLPLHILNLNILKVTGRSDLFFRLEIIKKVMLVISIIFTYRLGIMALLWGQVAVSVAAYYLNSLYAGQLANYPLSEQLRDFLPYLMMSLAMGISMYLASSTVSSSIAQLCIAGVVGSMVYLGLSYLVSAQVLREVLSLTLQAINPRNKVEPQT
jgi:teichuronic acid exporter